MARVSYEGSNFSSCFKFSELVGSRKLQDHMSLENFCIQSFLWLNFKCDCVSFLSLATSSAWTWTTSMLTFFHRGLTLSLLSEPSADRQVNDQSVGMKNLNLITKELDRQRSSTLKSWLSFSRTNLTWQRRRHPSLCYNYVRPPQYKSSALLQWRDPKFSTSHLQCLVLR